MGQARIPIGDGLWGSTTVAEEYADIDRPNNRPSRGERRQRDVETPNDLSCNVQRISNTLEAMQQQMHWLINARPQFAFGGPPQFPNTTPMWWAP